VHCTVIITIDINIKLLSQRWLRRMKLMLLCSKSATVACRTANL
jgi:hypothetical protein